MAYNPWNPPNQHNHALQTEARIFRELMNRGRLKTQLLDLNFANAGDTQQEPFYVATSIPLEFQAPNSEFIILEYQLEPGMNAVITGIFQDYDSGGQADNWVQGDGQLRFFLSVDNRYVPSFTSVTTRLGAPGDPQSIPRGIPVFSGQLVTYTAVIAPDTIIVTQPALLTVGIQGVKFPNR